MIELIDKKSWISYVLYKDKCITLNKVHRLKTIKILGRNPNNVIFLDVTINIFSMTQQLAFCSLITSVRSNVLMVKKMIVNLSRLCHF